MDSEHLAFEAGRVAQRLGWDDVDLVEPAGLASTGPLGIPVMVLCAMDLDVDEAKTVAAIHAAGRKIALLCAQSPSPAILEWLPEGVLNVRPNTQGGGPPTWSGQSAEVRLWLRLARDENSGVRGSTARSSHCPPECLAELARDSDTWVRAAAAGNPNLPDDLLVELSLDRDAAVQRAAMGSGRLSSERLESMLNRPAGRPFRARREHSADQLKALANDSDVQVREAVAQNRSTPAETLARLANDSDVQVREAVAQNRSTSPETLARLSDDPEVRVKAACALNPRTPEDAAVRLANAAASESDYDLFEALDEGTQLEPGLFSNLPLAVGLALMDSSDYFEQYLLRESWVPQERVVRASSSSDRVLRGAAAANPNCTPEMLRGLAKDPEAFVRAKAAQNPRTPADALNALAIDTDWYGWTRDGYGESHGPVFASVAENPSATSEVLTRVLKTAASTYDVSDDSYENPWQYISLRLASHPNSTEELLDDLMRVMRTSPITGWAAGVAAHPNASPRALAELSATEEPRVWLALLERDDLPEAATAALRTRA